MRSVAFILAVAGFAAAQTSTSSEAAAGVASTTVSAATSTSTSGCGDQVDAIIHSCLGTENAQLQACGANDWDCLCTQSTNVLTCYNNCPSDPNAFAAQQSNTAYCNAAKAYGSSSKSVTASATASVSSDLASALASESATATQSTQSIFTGFASVSASGSPTTSTDAAAHFIAPAGGLAAVLGLAALI